MGSWTNNGVQGSAVVTDAPLEQIPRVDEKKSWYPRSVSCVAGPKRESPLKAINYPNTKDSDLLILTQFSSK